VLEIGSGVGNLTCKLIPRDQYVASDINPLYLKTLEALSRERPYMQASYGDVTDLSSFASEGDFSPYDTVICLNVIEHVEDDRKALTNIKNLLADGGTAIVLVPQGQWNYGTLDEVLGHRRRYSKKALEQLARDTGLVVKEILEFNRISTLAWFLNGKILYRRTFGLLQIWMLDLLTPIFRIIDPFFPFPGLSLIAILQRKDATQQDTTSAEERPIQSPALEIYVHN
jgi:2-polyprenyl-3-methyl-5-hydroxy-6-metoxy-1,4-benzoquinol methylase